jgi:hypothetical protein
MTSFKQLSALLALARFPIPVLAITTICI